ncbi:MAG: hypothetical protein PHR28_08430 [candidate division Zixibacteria bacterium]|nr:hypothetical protein [candidate division Zixibacteria bacterium]
MEFSSGILIESGLNLAGYLVVAVLLYILIGRRTSKQAKQAASPANAVAAMAPTVTLAPSPKQRPADNPVFISLAAGAPAAPSSHAVKAIAPDSDVVEQISRRENRRAIYREARRLLALGNSRRELMDKFPLTEDEIELLSVAGKA